MEGRKDRRKEKRKEKRKGGRKLMHPFVEAEENDQAKEKKSNQGVEDRISQRQLQTIPPIPHGLFTM